MGVSRTIGVIAVSYFNYTELKRLIASMLMQKNQAWTLVVVDNSLDSEENMMTRALENLDPRIRVLTSSENLGFMPAAIASLPMVEGATWTIICNSDVEFVDSETFSRILETETPDIAVLAPQITDWFTGASLNPFLEQRPDALWLFFRLLGTSQRYLHYVMTILHSWVLKLKKFQRLSSADSPRSIYAAHGSCLILASDFANSLTGIEFQRLYGEELTIANHAQRSGRAVFYDPRLTTIHYSHASTNSLAVEEVRKLQFTALKTYSRDRKS
jgi:GT2 family glycosyltransferase